MLWKWFAQLGFNFPVKPIVKQLLIGLQLRYYLGLSQRVVKVVSELLLPEAQMTISIPKI